MDKYNISLNFGLTQYKNILFWLYEAAGLYNPHSSMETKYFYHLIEKIAIHFKNDEKFDISIWQSDALLMNEAWFELFNYKRKLLDEQTINEYFLSIPDKLLYNPDIDSENWSLDRSQEHISIKGVRKYSFHSIDNFEPNTAYKIVLKGINSENVGNFTHGVYDNKNNRIIKYINTPLTDEVTFSFITGPDDTSSLHYNVYAGLHGLSYGKNIYFDRIEVYKTKNISLKKS